jgi:carboxylate-amine ligase
MTFIPDFSPSKPYTIGVEVEFQLIDKNFYDLSQVGPDILQKVPAEFLHKIKPEFIQSMLEVATGVCHDITEVEDDLRSTILFLAELADDSDAFLFASSLHPFANYRDQLITPGERYAKLMDELQIAGRQLITQGLHVHIGMPDCETLIRVCDGIRSFLPLLLALTTSSPYYGGEDTGFYSYRSRLLDALSRSGLPYTFRNWQSYIDLVTDLHNAGLIEDVRDIWWDVRPHPELGTVEIRICDMPGKFSEILSVVAFVQALVKTLAESPPKNRFPRLEIIANNKWQAARYGLHGKFIDLENISTPLTIKKAIHNTLDLSRNAFKSLNSENYIQNIENIVLNGTGTDRFKDMLRKKLSFSDCIKKMHGDFWN